MACVGTRGSGFRGSALGRSGEGRTSVDGCMLPDHARDPGAALAARRAPVAAALRPGEQRGPGRKRGVQHGELNSSIACSL